MIYFIYSIIVFAGGLIQGLVGFGEGILVLMFLPHMMPMQICSGVVAYLNCCTCLPLTLQYRKHISWKIIGTPVLFSVVLMYFMRFISFYPSQELLKIILDLFLICLTLYYFVPKKTNAISGPAKYIIILITVLLIYFYGIGGPLMAIYFINNTSSKEEYLGNTEAYFLFICLIKAFDSVLKGNLTLNEIPYMLLGAFGVGAGIFLASRIIKYINDELMKKMVYIFIGIYGVTDLIYSAYISLR